MLRSRPSCEFDKGGSTWVREYGFAIQGGFTLDKGRVESLGPGFGRDFEDENDGPSNKIMRGF